MCIKMYIVTLIIYLLMTYIMKGFQYVEIALEEIAYYFETMWNTLDTILSELVEFIMTYIMEPLLDIVDFITDLYVFLFDATSDLIAGSLDLFYNTINVVICGFAQFFSV